MKPKEGDMIVTRMTHRPVNLWTPFKSCNDTLQPSAQGDRWLTTGEVLSSGAVAIVISVIETAADLFILTSSGASGWVRCEEVQIAALASRGRP